MNYIAKFNPYSMDDQTILSLATGRKGILENVLETLRDNLNSDSISQHLLVRGPRGMGKSFFLKYLQINFKKEEVFNQSEFVLLPEEQSNINTPAELIKLILNIAKNEASQNVAPMWSEADDLWSAELAGLKKYIADKKKVHPNYMMVVVLENLDAFIKNIESDKKKRKVHLSSFRYLLENLEGFTFVGAIPHIDSDIDSDYNSRLFHAFKKCTLRPWVEDDYLKYFKRRRRVIEEELNKKYDNKKLDLVKAKLKAISLYTGGSPRIAVVLTNLLLEDDVVSTANTLNGLIDDLTPYYQDLTKSLPKNSRILFDALIRHGENLSQSELAKAVGATQSQISKAFLWLKENGYVYGKKRTNSPAYTYAVADRIHVLYHIQREIHHNQSFSSIWLLCDFLVSFYKPEEIRDHALRELPNQSSQDLARVYMLSSEMMSKEQLLDFQPQDGWQKLIEEDAVIKELFGRIESMVEEDKVVYSTTHLEENVNSLFARFEEISNKELLQRYLAIVKKYGDQLLDNQFYDSSILVFKKVVGLIKQGDLELPIEDAYVSIAKSFEEIGHYSESIQFYEESMKLYKIRDNDKMGALIYLSLGNVYNKKKEYLKAISSYTESSVCFDDLQEFKWMAVAQFKIGYNYSLLEMYEEAIQAFEESKRLYEKVKDEKMVASSHYSIGHLLFRLNKFESSISYHKKSLAMYEEFGELNYQAKNLLGISICHMELDDHKTSLSYLKNAFEISPTNESELKQIVTELYAHELVICGKWKDLVSVIKHNVNLVESIFGGLGDAISFSENKKGLSKGFEIGNRILHLLIEISNEIDVHKALKALFLNLFKLASSELIIDLSDEALSLYPAPENQLILNAIKLTYKYIESGRSKTFLETVNPDTAIAIVEIASIVNLELKK